MRRPTLARISRRHHRIVRRHFPLRRRRHCQVQRRLDVGLIEAGQESVRVIRLEMRVQVLFAILRIDKLVKSCPNVVVLVRVRNLHHVLRRQVRPSRYNRFRSCLTSTSDPLTVTESIDFEVQSRNVPVDGSSSENRTRTDPLRRRPLAQTQRKHIPNIRNPPRPLLSFNLAQHIQRVRRPVHHRSPHFRSPPRSGGRCRRQRGAPSATP